MKANHQRVTIDTDLGELFVLVEVWQEDDGIQAVINSARLEALPRFNVADAMPDDLVDEAVDLAVEEWKYGSE